MLMFDAVKLFVEWKSLGVKTGTMKGYGYHLRSLCLYLRNPQIEAVSLEEIIGYLNAMLYLGWDQNTLIPMGISFRKFFEYLRLKELKVLNPELIPIPRKKFEIPRVATEENYQKLLDTIPKNSNDPRHIRNLAMITMLRDSGARITELLSLNTVNLDLFRMKAILLTEKSRGKRPVREIMWMKNTNEYLKKWLEKRESLAAHQPFADPDAVFVCISGQLYGRRFTLKGAGESLRRYCNKAKIPYINAHSLRHKRLHEIVHNGGSAADVMNIAGHSSIASSTVYTQMYGDELEQRYRLLFGSL